MENNEKPVGRPAANRLVEVYAKHAHVGAASLNADDDRSFGDYGFHYNANTDSLTVRVLIMRAHLTDSGPKAAANNLKVAAALNDPKIGGMYERAGGKFILDKEKELFFLTKDFSVGVDVHTFVHAVDDLINLGVVWTMRWVAHVANQTLANEPLPAYPVTRQNDPYRPR